MKNQTNSSHSSNEDIRVGTIRAIHRALIADGYAISECALRSWVKTGMLPAVYNGAVAYISYDNVVKMLTMPQESAS